MTDYKPIIQQAYREILGRDGDAPGLAGWNTRMQGGFTEAQLREAFIRSPEYASKHPDVVPPIPPDPPPGPLAPVRIVGNQFQPRLFGLIACCSGPAAIDIAKGWPLVAPEWVDSFASARANLTHVRMGPFSDQGYGWDYVRRVRDIVKYANSKGLYVEVDLVDAWALVHREPNLYNDGPEVTHAAPPLHYQHFVRHVVKETGDLAVIYNIGNEGWRTSPTHAWEDGIYNVAKTALRDFGYPDRPIGSNWNLNTAVTIPPGGRRLYDFVANHGFGLQTPLAVPALLNESDNEPHTAQAWLDLKAQSEANGTYVAAWRGVDDAEWDKLLVRLGGRPPVGGPPAPTACYLGYPRNYSAGPDQNPTLVDVVAAAVESAIAFAPWNYADGGNRLAVNDARSRITHYSLVQSFLQPRCVEVGDPAKSWDGRDSVDVARNAGPCPNTGGVFEGYHLINWGGGGVFRGGSVRNAFRGTVTHNGGPNQGC